MTGVALDGNGNLHGPTNSYKAGYFAAFGVVPDGHVDVTFGPGSEASRELIVTFRASADGSTFYIMIFTNDAIYLNKSIAGTSTQVAAAGGNPINRAGAASLGVSFAGNTFKARLNGADTTVSFTDASITANGRVGFGSANSGGLIVSSVSVGQ